MIERFNILKAKGYDNDRFEAYLKNPNVKKIYTKENLAELKALWYGDEIIEQEEEILVQLSDDVEAMTKDQLDEYSINTYGIDLDKRFTKENMLEELEEELKKQNEE